MVASQSTTHQTVTMTKVWGFFVFNLKIVTKFFTEYHILYKPKMLI